MGHFSHFFYRVKEQPPFLKNKKKSDAFYVPAHYCFPGHILKPLAQKKNLKRDYGLWVILLIMPSTWGHFVLFLFAPKQLYAALVVSNITPAANHCYLSTLIPQSRGKIKKPMGLLLVGHIDAFVVDDGPIFLIPRYTPSRQKASLLTSPQKT